MSKTVLIVEDNALNMKLFHDLLEAHGIDTIECSNGLEVLKIAREKKPDLILMDIQLPEVSGLDVTRWLKDDASLKDIPVIAVTAFAMKGDEEKIREGGCEDYISKPISVTRFLEVVQKYLGAVENKPAAPTGSSAPDTPSKPAPLPLESMSMNPDLDEPLSPPVTVEAPPATTDETITLEGDAAAPEDANSTIEGDTPFEIKDNAADADADTSEDIGDETPDQVMNHTEKDKE